MPVDDLRDAVHGLMPRAKDDNPIRVVERIRLQNHAIDDAEDGRVQANAEAEAEDRSKGKALAVPEAQQGVSDVSEERHGTGWRLSVPQTRNPRAGFNYGRRAGAAGGAGGSFFLNRPYVATTDVRVSFCSTSSSRVSTGTATVKPLSNS